MKKGTKTTTVAADPKLEARKGANDVSHLLDDAQGEAIEMDAQRRMNLLHSAAGRINRRIDDYNEVIRYSRAQVANFGTKLATAADPLYAMSWASEVFEHSAKVSALPILVRILIVSGPEAALEACTAEALRVARCRPSSTSVTSNLAEQCKAEVFARAVDELRSTVQAVNAMIEAA